MAKFWKMSPFFCILTKLFDISDIDLSLELIEFCRTLFQEKIKPVFII